MNQYNCQVDMDMVLAICHAAKMSETEILAFFDGVLEQMASCPPNFVRKLYEKKESTIKDKVWILRGYYPGTAIFFRATLILKTEDWVDTPFYIAHVKASYPTKKRMMGIDSKQVRAIVAESALFGSKVPSMLKIKPQRLLTPKGMEPFRLKDRDE
jgi:hypothetical protein